MKRLLSLIVLLQCGVALFSAEPFRVMFYNVENLFDCRHDTLKNDNEFLPESARKWDWRKYNDKLSKIAKVIVATSYKNVPDLVGLCEVENDKCLTDLTKNSPLREAGYRYVMTDSPDERGIDVALLYQRATFKLISCNSVRIPNRVIDRHPTRDILHVTGKVVSGDSLDVFVCHMPSRSGGEKKSEPYRLFTSKILKQYVDSVMKVRRNPNIIIMGDFNDYPTSKSIADVLDAKAPSKKNRIEKEKLYNLMDGRKDGTYRYKGEWNVLDQMVVSGNMLRKRNNISTKYNNANIVKHQFLMEEDDKYGGLTPSRTYWGSRYHGGYSDHLPVSLDLKIKN
jgi:Predicted extracellular nuclease